MKFSLVASLIVVSMSGFASVADAQEENRFDAQVFRPSAAPRDLVVVQKSEVIGHLSPTLGLYYDLGFDPLVLVSGDTGETIEAVSSRLQVTALAGIGLFDWADVKLAMPLVAYQSSDNLRPIGTEGEVQQTAVGDMRVSARVSIPGFNRKKRVTRGVGLAVVGDLNLPTGSSKAFTGDGVLTGGLTAVADYRFANTIITTNAGVWLRPERQFAGVRVGDMASFGVAAESYVIQSRGISVLGGVYGYPSLNKFPDSARQIPAEAMLAMRWQTKWGVTWTAGGSFGAACAFAAPALRLFSGVSWVPSNSREQEQIDRILLKNSLDPDGDGLTEAADLCPDKSGPAANNGCPDEDTDGDGVVDREDDCPIIDGADGKDGCPPAYIKGDEIIVLDKVHFATDKDIILPISKPALDAVARVLKAQPDLLLVHIEGHTDVRASDAYNLDLSQRRVSSVRAYLIDAGIAPQRLVARGYGHTKPLYDDSACNKPDEELDAQCLFLTSKNRRVVFRIVRRGDPSTAPMTPAVPPTAPPMSPGQTQPGAPQTAPAPPTKAQPRTKSRTKAKSRTKVGTP
jgi:outer membrane protein OmpA-like peptidoglycan-associated protein